MHSHEHDLPLRVANRASGGPESHDQDLAARVVEPSDPFAAARIRRESMAIAARQSTTLLYRNLSFCESVTTADNKPTAPWITVAAHGKKRKSQQRYTSLGLERCGGARHAGAIRRNFEFPLQIVGGPALEHRESRNQNFGSWGPVIIAICTKMNLARPALSKCRRCELRWLRS